MSPSPKTYAAYAKECRIRARSSLRLAVFFLLVSTGSCLYWGLGWNVWLPMFIAGLSICSWILESLWAKSNERKSSDIVSKSYDSPPTIDTKFSLVTYEGDAWYEKRIQFQGEQVFMRLHQKPPLHEMSLIHAEKVIARLELISNAFEAFKRQQARQQPDLAREILDLKIDSIDFYSPTKPNVAEVSFTEESGGENWLCVLDGFKFRDLSKEN